MKGRIEARKLRHIGIRLLGFGNQLQRHGNVQRRKMNAGSHLRHHFGSDLLMLEQPRSTVYHTMSDCEGLAG